MTDAQTETIKGFCTIALTKHIMAKYELSQDDSFSKLMNTEFYKIFLNVNSGLYLEPDFFLYKACDLELDGKTNEMYDFIQNN